ncbi:MAG: hypothetical protein IPK19_10850 [Chloroflexi bacterium]|nr:hypothetical protein [Chloroflexota bacterium]
MIQELLDHIVQILRQELTGAIPNIGTHVLLGPVAEPAAATLPVIALTPGALAIPPGARDLSSSEPRPQPFVQTIPVNPASPQGPYPLTKTPMNTSALCKLVLDVGTLDERQVLLIEGSDYIVDYQVPSIAFSAAIPLTSAILLRYAFAGVFTIQNFQQDFTIEVYESNHTMSEKWLALALAAVMTHYDELLERFNTTQPTLYSGGVLGSAHRLTQLQPSGAVLVESPHIRWRMTFRTAGQLTLTRASEGGFSLIEKIRSPGQHSGEAVDIAVGLE